MFDDKIDEFFNISDVLRVDDEALTVNVDVVKVFETSYFTEDSSDEAEVDK